jgi:hypothetical protein
MSRGLRFLGRRLLDLSWLLLAVGAAVWLLWGPGPSPEPLPDPKPKYVTGPSLEAAIARMGQDPAQVYEP